MNNSKILIIDDDINLCRSLKIALSAEGADVVIATDGRIGLQRFYKHQPDIVILDVRMPEMDGWETLRQIQLVSTVPVVMLTSLSEDHEMLRGLKMGADDYVTKPFSRDILIERIRIALRRTQAQQTIQPQERSDHSVYDDGYLHVNLGMRLVQVRGKSIKLSSTEFRLLEFLINNANRPLSYEQILENVWGWEYKNDTSYAQVYLSHLRKKLEENPKNPKYFLNEFGIGYRFCSYQNQKPGDVLTDSDYSQNSGLQLA